MKRKTKNFIEDTLIIIVILAVVYLIYAYFFKEDLKIEEVDNVNKTELSIGPMQKESSLLETIYSEIKEILFEEDKNKYETNILKKEEPQKDIHLQRAEDRFQSVIDTNNTNSLENQTKLPENSETIENSLDNLKEEKTQEEEKVNEDLSRNDTILEEEIKEAAQEEVATLEENKENLLTNSDSIKEEQEENNQENSLNETNEIVTKPLNELKDETRKSNTFTTKNLNSFFQNLEKKISSNIKKNLNSSNFKEGEFVNIRVTILKSGKYEQLTFINGNKEYFNKMFKHLEQVILIRLTHFKVR